MRDAAARFDQARERLQAEAPVPGMAEAPAELINAEAAGELLDVPKSWVLAEARQGRIPHVRLGRYVRFEPDVLREWWRGRRQGPAVTP